MCKRMNIFEEKEYFGMEATVVERLWHTLSVILVACWGFFQSVHHLLITLVFIMAVNIFLRTILTIKNCNKRRRVKKKIDLLKCVHSLGYLGILGEFAVVGFGLCFLSVIYRILGSNGDNSPEWLFWVIEVLSYFSFLVYTIMTFDRLSLVFPDTTIVKAAKWLISVININSFLPPALAGKINVDKDDIKKLGEVIEDGMEENEKKEDN